MLSKGQNLCTLQYCLHFKHTVHVSWHTLELLKPEDLVQSTDKFRRIVVVMAGGAET
jgi:hypothetical protein